MKKQYLMLIVVILMATIIFLTFLLLPKNNTPVKISPAPSPQVDRPLGQFAPVEMNDVPFNDGGANPGVDLESQIVKNSEQEIKKLGQFLPFQKDLLTSSGKNISILIPSQKNQYNPWTLSVNISGINYQEPTDDARYQIAKANFLEGAEIVFEWMISKGVEPKKIIITWGDRAFIQERAELWLSQ